MTSATTLLVVLVVVALAFDFLNGFHDSANVVATIVASRAMSARGALMLAAAGDFSGPFLFGLAVAQTVGSEVAQPHAVTIAVVLAALLAASAWDVVTWLFGLPASSSHALIGGIVGAAAAGSGWSAIELAGLSKVGIALLVSPLAGFVAAVVAMQATRLALAHATPRANVLLSRLQLATGAVLAVSHGANDAQKTMGVIALGLFTLGVTREFTVPWWVVLASASAISLGTMSGGWRIIRTLGARFYRVRPIHAFASQVGSAAVILGASLAGGPVSSTHVVSLSILGAGAAERKSKVRWAVLGDMALAWLVTIPVTALCAVPLYHLIDRLIGGH